LWEGRYKSCFVDSETFVLSCYRYIELNPVRARMNDDPTALPALAPTHGPARARSKFADK
jgi:putative transposase